jgi:ABC-type multidrug transport system fused ATPase/permease subunit
MNLANTTLTLQIVFAAYPPQHFIPNPTGSAICDLRQNRKVRADLAANHLHYNLSRNPQKLTTCDDSGKSTLLATLLRLIPVDGGTISVDDADISNMRPDQVRSRFITLPQEPVLVAGTVRHNMQLYESSCEDRDMISALDAFGLWDTILAKGGLDVPLTEELLSHGQRQLFCFARSTLQEGNIVILDEPSSQSDRAIEQMMERSIRERFKSHTVLCIAHKLATILSFDTVIVMDAGSVAESGNPRTLLQDRTSLFSTLMQSQCDYTDRA